MKVVYTKHKGFFVILTTPTDNFSDVNHDLWERIIFLKLHFPCGHKISKQWKGDIPLWYWHMRDTKNKDTNPAFNKFRL